MRAYEKLQQFMREKHRQPNWETAWRDLAELTEGITKNDPRFQPVCHALEQCDQSFESGNWLNFQKAASELKEIMGHRNT